MTRERTTLSRRFGALFAGVLVIMGTVAVVAALQLRRMDTDAERIIEEAREQAIDSRIVTDLRALETLLGRPDEVGQTAEQLVGNVLAALGEMGHSVDDPSRPGHQEQEDELGTQLHATLLSISELLHSGGGDLAEFGDATDLVERARHYAEVLLSEAAEEALEADEDFTARAHTLQATLIATVAISALLLGVALGLVHRGVVRPLRRLRAGAERLGRGDLEHRISGESHDELGDVADAFNAMADRLADAHADLEARVRQRTQEFLRAARLADLGVLASGIAHEVNTPLASIASCAAGLRRRVLAGELDDEVLDEYTEIISQETQRAREVTTRMLALVRQEPSEVARTSLHAVVRQAVAALRHRAEQRRVMLEWRDPGEDHYLELCAGELIQILVNLLTNACDASPPGGRVTLDTTVSDGRLVLVVSDEGEGIPEDRLDRIFEPFYTTKTAGNGTGLGLPLVAALVEHHGGKVSVASRPGEGSRFTVDLPADWGNAS